MIAQDKRNLLTKSLSDDSMILIVGNKEVVRNGDVMYPFRQDSDFLLFTGLHIPDLILVGQKREWEMQWTLYSDSITPHENLWWTSRLSHRELAVLSGISDIREKKWFKKDIMDKIQSISSLYVWTDRISREEKALFQKLRLSKIQEKLVPLNPILDELRIIKTPEEIENIRQAIRVTCEAYNKIRANIKPKMYEYEIEAIVAGVYRSHHLTEAYPTIVASGSSACTLHYAHHTRQIEENDLVLVDFWAEYHGYAADITRVFSISGMSVRQKVVYEGVISVKKYAESLIRPGVKKSDYELQVRTKMNEELEKLGLIPLGLNWEEKLILSRKYYPHSTSHFLGLDVHDVGERDAILRAGMVITCEPGIYIPEEGIGIRLEDDILVTESGCENLSRDIPL